MGEKNYCGGCGWELDVPEQMQARIAALEAEVEVECSRRRQAQAKLDREREINTRLEAKVERLRLENGTLSAMVTQGENCPDACPEVERLQGALEEIAVGAGPFSRDPLTHAEGCIDSMKSLATAALSPIISAAELTGCENATYCTAERVEDKDE